MILELFSCNCGKPSCDCPFYITLLSPAASVPNTGDMESAVHRCCNILCCHFFLYSAGYFSSSANVNKHSCTSFACIAANKWPKTALLIVPPIQYEFSAIFEANKWFIVFLLTTQSVVLQMKKITIVHTRCRFCYLFVCPVPIHYHHDRFQTHYSKYEPNVTAHYKYTIQFYWPAVQTQVNSFKRCHFIFLLVLLFFYSMHLSTHYELI